MSTLRTLLPASEGTSTREGNARHRPVPVAHRVALLGNTNVGKTSLFERLCAGTPAEPPSPGEVVHARLRPQPAGSNLISYERHRCRGCAGCALATSGAGGEADVAAGPVPCAEVFDLPSTRELFAGGVAQSAARRVLVHEGMHAVIVVLDAKNLRRSLALALEVAEFGIPMLLDLNMVDEAESMGIHIDDDELARAFNLPVIRTEAARGVGVRRLAELIFDARAPTRRTKFSPVVEVALAELEPLLEGAPRASRAMALALLAEDPSAWSWAEAHRAGSTVEKCRRIVERAACSSSTPLRVAITNAAFAEAERIAARAQRTSQRRRDVLSRFGRLAQRPLAGTAIALVVLVVAYLWVGAFAATWVVNNIQERLFDGLLLPWVGELVDGVPSGFLRALIVDPEFGVLPTGVFLAVGIVMPVLLAFYLLHGVLEDSGYLPRLAVLLDRGFRKVGLNGKALIPLVLGFSCITMAVITTRVLTSKKERIIATLLLSMGIPCAPLMAVMVVILGTLPWTATLVVVGVLATQLFVAGHLASRLLRGSVSDFILELPPMRLPNVRRVATKTFQRTWLFLREAVPIFVFASVIMFLFHWFGGLAAFETAARPVIRDFLGLPDQAVQVFIKTVIRRESGATELNLLRSQFDNVQLVVTLVVLTFLIPCVNAVFVMFKEHGVRIAMAILATAISWALILGAVLRLGLRATGLVS